MDHIYIYYIYIHIYICTHVYIYIYVLCVCFFGKKHIPRINISMQTFSIVEITIIMHCKVLFVHLVLICFLTELLKGLKSVKSLFCDKTFPGEDTTHISIHPYRECKTDQSMDTIKIQLGEPMDFIGVTYRNRNDSGIALSSKPTLA